MKLNGEEEMGGGGRFHCSKGERKWNEGFNPPTCLEPVVVLTEHSLGQISLL